MATDIIFTYEDENGEDYTYEATAADLEDFAVMKLKGFGLTEEQANAIVRYYDVEFLNIIAWYDEKEAEGYFRERAAEEHRNQADVVMSDERDYIHHVYGGLR